MRLLWKGIELPFRSRKIVVQARQFLKVPNGSVKWWIRLDAATPIFNDSIQIIDFFSPAAKRWLESNQGRLTEGEGSVQLTSLY